VKLDKESLSALLKLLVFLVVTGAATALLAMTMSNIQLGGSREYKALFTDATGVTKGDDVRIAGVSVGSVKKVQIKDRDKAEVVLCPRPDHADQEHERPDPVPEPGGSAVHRVVPGHR